MKNWKKLLLTVVPATLAVSFTAFAGQWSQDMNGWRYENDDGSYCRNGWYWLDGNQDGIAECYISLIIFFYLHFLGFLAKQIARTRYN